MQIKDKSVSRMHVEIARKEDGYVIIDLKSRNGTFLDGVRIGPNVEYELRPGMPIAIGRTFFSLDKAYPDDVMSALDEVDLFKELDAMNGSGPDDRPSTAKKNMELVYKVSQVLMQSLNTKEILERILRHILELLRRIDRGVIVLLNRQTGGVGDVISIVKSKEANSEAAYSRSVVERVVREGKPVTMLDTLSETEANLSESIRLNRIRSIMCVPLVSRARIVGAIYVDSVNRPHGFRKEDLDLLTALSSPAAVAIENSLLRARRAGPRSV